MRNSNSTVFIEVNNCDDFHKAESLFFRIGAGYPAADPIYRSNTHQTQNAPHFRYIICDESGALSLKNHLGGLESHAKRISIDNEDDGSLNKLAGRIEALREHHNIAMHIKTLSAKLSHIKADKLNNNALFLINQLNRVI